MEISEGGYSVWLKKIILRWLRSAGSHLSARIAGSVWLAPPLTPPSRLRLTRLPAMASILSGVAGSGATEATGATGITALLLR